MLNSLEKNLKLASEAGLYCNIRATTRGLVVDISGFRDRIQLLLREVVCRIQKYHFTPTEFTKASKEVSVSVEYGIDD